MPGSIPICDVCGMNTVPDEWFMVHDDLWSSTGLREHDATLCVGCFEAILGRQLRPEDFAPVDTNQPNTTMSARLLSRMGYAKVAVNDAGEHLPVWAEPEPRFEPCRPRTDDGYWL